MANNESIFEEYAEKLRDCDYLLLESRGVADGMGVSRVAILGGVLGVGTGIVIRRLASNRPAWIAEPTKMVSGVALGIGVVVGGVGVVGELMGRKFLSLIREEQVRRSSLRNG